MLAKASIQSILSVFYSFKNRFAFSGEYLLFACPKRRYEEKMHPNALA